jgi:hypothetical protein
MFRLSLSWLSLAWRCVQYSIFSRSLQSLTLSLFTFGSLPLFFCPAVPTQTSMSLPFSFTFVRALCLSFGFSLSSFPFFSLSRLDQVSVSKSHRQLSRRFASSVDEEGIKAPSYEVMMAFMRKNSVVIYLLGGALGWGVKVRDACRRTFSLAI